MEYLLFNSEGLLVTRYDSSINTNIPPEAVEVSNELFFRTINEQDGIWKLVNNEVVKLPRPPVVESFASQVKRYEQAVEDHLDAGAKASGFDNIDRARIPAGYPNPQQALSITFGNWHTDVWAYCRTVLASVEGGGPVPALADFIASLPVRAEP